MKVRLGPTTPLYVVVPGVKDHSPGAVCVVQRYGCASDGKRCDARTRLILLCASLKREHTRADNLRLASTKSLGWDAGAPVHARPCISTSESGPCVEYSTWCFAEQATTESR